MIPRPSPIARFYVFRALSTVGFITPIFTIFLLYRELSFTEIGLLSTYSAVLIVVAEIPTGYIGDRIGRRVSMIISSIMYAVSLFGFLLAETFLAFVIVYTPWALGMAFASGSIDAWLFEILNQHDRADTFTTIRGRASACNLGAGMVTMIAGGILYTVDPTHPFLAGGILQIGAIAVGLSLPATDTFSERTATETPAFRAVLGALRSDFATTHVRLLVIFAALAFALIESVNMFIQPIVVETVAPLFGDGSDSSVVFLGILYAIFAITSAGAAYVAGPVRAWIGEQHALLAIPTIAGFILLVPVVLPVIAAGAFLVVRASAALYRPIVMHVLNVSVDSVGRVTALSAVSLLFAIVRAPVKVTSGVIADAIGPLMTVGLLGVGLALTTGACVIFGLSATQKWTITEPATG